MQSIWSLDVHAMVRPAATFASVRAAPVSRGMWTACRRPLFVAFTLACSVSLIATGALTLRIVAPAAMYWASVPMVEALALLVVIGHRRSRSSTPAMIDVFFAGHAAWTLLLIALAGTLASTHPAQGWVMVLNFWVAATLVVIAWSAYVDFCFFRHYVGETRSRATRDVALHRLMVWTVVFAIFALPSMTPSGFADVFSEIFRG